MPSSKRPRKGSLQYWPRKRAEKFLPNINWDSIDYPNSKKTLKGIIAYKAGMASAYVKDETADSMTKGKKIIIPVTVLECPPMKILSVRFYKHGIVYSEILNENLDKELRRKLKLPKSKSKKIDDIKNDDYDDLKVIAYSVVKKSGLKKTPDICEIGLAGTKEEKFSYIKENLNKEISPLDVFEKGQLIDVRGLTKGKGLVGPVKRFGITLKAHKSEKGVRRPGSLGPWHPARVTYMAPLAGQLGMFTRAVYNNKVIQLGKAEDLDSLKNIKNYGNVNTNYILVCGSVQGAAKRQLILTRPLRTTKKQLKKNYELIELR
jgi:large subunit ribosomal protein L3